MHGGLLNYTCISNMVEVRMASKIRLISLVILETCIKAHRTYCLWTHVLGTERHVEGTSNSCIHKYDSVLHSTSQHYHMLWLRSSEDWECKMQLNTRKEF